MENNSQISVQNEIQQQINQLKTKNDNLLHKYVANKMEKYSMEYWSHIALFGAFIILGIFLHESINLKWPVIIVIWVVTLGLAFFSFSICQPITSSRIAITPTVTLRENLLTFSKNAKIFNAIQGIACLILSIWLAFEVEPRLYLCEIAYKLDMIDVNFPKVVFYAILLIGVVSAIECVVGISSVDKYVNKVVADIDEARP